MKKETEVLWRKHKYEVMFHSQKHYNEIRQHMREGAPLEVVSSAIEEALKISPTIGSARNACEHMWGYFKKNVSEKEKDRYRWLIEEGDFEELLCFIRELANEHDVHYLQNSTILR